MQSPDLISPFVVRLEALGVAYFVTGSMAGILYGEPRMTHDVDLVVALASKDVAAFVAAFPLEEFYCPPEDVVAIETRRGQRGHFNLIHHESGFKADVYLAFDALHRWAMAHRQRVVLDGTTIWIAPVEYVITRKLEYFREGGSEKHLRDIRGMLEGSKEHIDHALLEGWIARLGLAGAWGSVGSG